MHTPLVIGNWKMNPGTLTAATRLFKDVQALLARSRNTEVVVAPPSVFLSEIGKLAQGKRINVGAQDVFFEEMGAHTGEVSLQMLKSIGVKYCILGHSERRARGESSEDIHKKVLAVIKGGEVAVLCVGETKRDQAGQYLSVVESQIREGLKGIPKTKLERLVIAYEPVWAIGTGETASPADIHEMKLFIQKVISDMFGRSLLSKVRIIYGGSVDKRNAEAILKEGAVDGFLVGGASLRAGEFGDIVKIAAAL